jgi:hypothetical protein
VHEYSQNIPVAGMRNALESAYHVGFSTTLNHLMIIGAVVAFVGAVGAVTLVRQRDYVVPGSPGAPSPGAVSGAPTEDAAVPAVHA